MSIDFLQDSLHAHLARWGLRHVLSDADYFAWQRAMLSVADLNQLGAQVERKRRGDQREVCVNERLLKTRSSKAARRENPEAYALRYVEWVEQL